jgi:hypothetical protein
MEAGNGRMLAQQSHCPRIPSIKRQSKEKQKPCENKTYFYFFFTFIYFTSWEE